MRCCWLALAVLFITIPKTAVSQTRVVDEDPFEVFAKIGFGVDLNDIAKQSCDTAKTDFAPPITTTCDGGKAAAAIDAGAVFDWNFGGRFGLEVSSGVRKTGTTKYTNTATLGPQEVFRRAEANYTELVLKVGPRFNLGAGTDLVFYYGLFHYFANINVADEARNFGTRVGGTSEIIKKDGSRHFMLGIVAYLGAWNNPFLRPYFEYTAMSFKQVVQNSENPAGFPTNFYSHSFTGGVSVPIKNW